MKYHFWILVTVFGLEIIEKVSKNNFLARAYTLTKF
jgi:hypothetical protein